MKKGIGQGVVSSIMWGIDTVLMGIVLTMTPFIETENAIFLAPFISACLHDILSSIWLIIYLSSKNMIKSLIAALKTKSGKIVIIGAILGGPVGMTGYLLAIKYIGASYTAAISSLYPAIGAILATLVLKEKVGVKSWIGLFVSISGIVLLGYSPNSNNIEVLGFAFAILCVIGWGAECVITAIGMKDDEVSPEHALQIRQLTSGLIYALLIIPLVGGIGLTFTSITSPVMILIGVTSLAGTVSYLFYYKAIYNIGPTKAMGLNIMYFVWAIIFETILLGKNISIKTIICGSIIVLGSYIVASQPSTSANGSSGGEVNNVV